MAILPESDLDAATVFADRVREAVETHPFDVGLSDPIRLTISAGIATYPNTQIENPDLLVDWADRALYAAKKGGRNRVMRAPDVGPPGFEAEPTVASA